MVGERIRKLLTETAPVEQTEELTKLKTENEKLRVRALRAEARFQGAIDLMSARGTPIAKAKSTEDDAKDGE